MDSGLQKGRIVSYNEFCELTGADSLRRNEVPGMNGFEYLMNSCAQNEDHALRLTTYEAVSPAHRFHSGMEGYCPTPLVSLEQQAKKLGLKAFLVKDESKRFGLNAFKVLGGSYAIAKYLCAKLEIPVDEKAYQILCSAESRAKLGEMTFVTATDGNHGRGVAWAARRFGHKAVVYMPKGTALERLENIQKLGAEAEILPFNYDDAVRHADRMAKEHGWVMVQDTAWPGYEEIPTWILQGYTTIAGEIEKQLEESGYPKPTHLLLQAGVGSVAGGMTGYFANQWGENCPKIIIVEPDRADCLFRTAKANDGEIHIVTGDMDSMMAGLCCGEPCTIAWEIIREHASAFVSCGDGYAARGMQLLGQPLEGDPAVVSGESGAVPAGVVQGIMTEERLKTFRELLGMNEDSCVLVISTEGDTDRENYRKVMQGTYSL